MASKASEGVGCYAETYSDLRDYDKSAVEYVVRRYYTNVLDKISKGYYGKSKCFSKMEEHVAREMPTEKFLTVADAFWASYPTDVNAHRPVLNTLDPVDWDRLNRLAPDGDAPFCSDARYKDIMSIKGAQLASLKSEYSRLTGQYRKMMTAQMTLNREIERLENQEDQKLEMPPVGSDPNALPVLPSPNPKLTRLYAQVELKNDKLEELAEQLTGLEHQMVVSERTPAERLRDREGPCARPL